MVVLTSWCNGEFAGTVVGVSSVADAYCYSTLEHELNVAESGEFGWRVSLRDWSLWTKTKDGRFGGLGGIPSFVDLLVCVYVASVQDQVASDLKLEALSY